MAMAKLQAPVAFLARFMLAFIFLAEGWSKLGNYGGAVQYMESHGVPGLLLPLVILTELGGGLLIVCGFQARLAALALSGFCILTALLFHADLTDLNELIHFNKDIAIAGGFLVLVAFGAGGWSLDALQARRAATLSSPSDALEPQG
jgi:putative oxidoreductase